ncbi:MAG TPA: hypothetical protein P5081_05860 [Phycisphaerae bacterium]|nr:hypothetical protein [Phycisphaerae bacterium]HRW52392.1 hypothetical protein [Phycisphaerae bacterium]
MSISSTACLLSADPLFVIGNQIEAGLWIVIGVGFLIAAIVRPAHRRRCAALGPVFVAFGFSDLVEVTTGAWWRPWWLFVWKGVCVLIFLIALVAYLIERSRAGRRDTPCPDPDPDPVDGG